MCAYKTDREIMLGAEDKVGALIAQLQSNGLTDPEAVCARLREIGADIHAVATSPIDYQVVVDHLDENILITDGGERILYVNPAYERSFGSGRETLVGCKISDLIKSGRYFTSSIAPEVIREKTRVMRLVSGAGNERPSIVVGVPILDGQENILYTVISIRSISSFADLRDHFHAFLSNLRTLHPQGGAVKIYENSHMISGEEPLVGNSAVMHNIQYLVEKVSDTDASVLITGESGTGKELVANAIYNASNRSNKPFIKVNCSSIPASLIESELFGYEKGAFSGASTSGKKGLFEAANGGTILLDEIGDMPLDAQAKLLRVLQSSEVTRVGGTRPVKLNIRVIASTNNNLKEKIKAGAFRQDLYYRLHIIPIHIPPLRERRDDIPLLCQHYLDVFANQYHRSVTLSEENMALLRDYSWPGNIRELRNIMEYLVVCCADIPYIDNFLLRGILDLEEEPASAAQETKGAETAENLTLGEAVARCEREMLKSTMRKVSSMKAASQLLGVDISTISRKLKQYGLSAKGEEL